MRVNKLNLPKHHINELKREVLERTRLMNEQYQKYCENNGRAYYPWRTQILLNKQDASKVVDDKIILIDNKYQSIYNDDGQTFKATNFANKKKLDKHIEAHISDFPGLKPENYESYAKSFLSQRVDGENILDFTNKNGFIFRYDKKRNIFATATPEGVIQTLYKPKNGLLYWEVQIDLYGRTKS